MSELRSRWTTAWPKALAVWSRFVQLSEPRWCADKSSEQREGLTASFAMIRLNDHAVVVSLRQIMQQKLAEFAVEILAHEIGHHVYCPADLSDNARLLARMRAGLPSKEHLAPMIANLYTDLLINDRLQRDSRLNMAGVYQRLNIGSTDRVWTFYMRVYEVLWNLPRGSLVKGTIDERLNYDAVLGARLIRSYTREWLDGAGRFACLILPYVIDDDGQRMKKLAASWHDTECAGAGGAPDGVADIDDAESEGAIHPSEDPELSGIEKEEDAEPLSAAPAGSSRVGSEQSGHKSMKKYRAPLEYADVLKASGVTLSDAEIVARYYRELAMPHLVPFPVRQVPQATDPHPEGLDVWDVGESLNDVDWLGTVVASPHIVPGVTTRQRIWGSGPGNTPQKIPIDLYLGVDCSGSMGDPSRHMSFPVLAGAVIALSALRAGSRVMVALSGEPGKTISTDGFVRDETLVLKTLTSYLGTGTTFGIFRLTETFRHRPASANPVHILIVTDNDIFSMLDGTTKSGHGWTIAGESLRSARGGGTFVLQLPQYLMNQTGAKKVVHPGCKRMRDIGWEVANVDSMEQLMEFARRFSREAYAGMTA
jgi:hypothetical protein